MREEPKMDFEKTLSQPNAGRRSFLWKAGAALSAAVATVVPGMAKIGATQGNGRHAEADRLSHRLGILEDEKAIRNLHGSYETLLHNGRYEEVSALFADDGEVVFSGGVFSGGKEGVARLYCDCFRSGLTGKKLGPAPGFETAAAQPQEAIQVAADRLSAQAQFPYSIQVGAPMPDSQLVRMARLHGEGILKWCEAGVCEVAYAKDAKDGTWKIKKLEYRVLSKTNYRAGKSDNWPISTPRFAKTYPEDPAGPDRFVAAG
jgi:hypothetical protein